MQRITLIENKWEIVCRLGNFPNEVNAVIMDIADVVLDIIMKWKIEEATEVMEVLYYNWCN
jgi:hypothetical protein